MKKPIVRIHNTETNEIIDREMTDKEFDAYQIQQAESLARKEEEDTKQAAKLVLLERLGISAEEAQLLLS